jgi:hypothetical protein
MSDTTARELAGQVITFLETGIPPAGLFTVDVFCDFTMPQWRLQAQGLEDTVALRKAGHPGPSSVPRSRFDETAAGFALEVEEQWDAADLAAAVDGHPGVTITQGEADVIDAQALGAYRARLAEIDAELAEADSRADQARSGRLGLGREALLGEVAAATGLSGRHRQFTSAQERARTAVRKAIVSALNRIERHDRALARQLRDAVRTGRACRYDRDPARPVVWITD